LTGQLRGTAARGFFDRGEQSVPARRVGKIREYMRALAQVAGKRRVFAHDIRLERTREFVRPDGKATRQPDWGDRTVT